VVLFKVFKSVLYLLAKEGIDIVYFFAGKCWKPGKSVEGNEGRVSFSPKTLVRDVVYVGEKKNAAAKGQRRSQLFITNNV